MSERRPRREYSEEFKKQMVTLYENGKPTMEIIREYELTPSTFHKWVRYYHSSGSFKSSDNKTPEQKELERFRKRKPPAKNGE